MQKKTFNKMQEKKLKILNIKNDKNTICEKL